MKKKNFTSLLVIFIMCMCLLGCQKKEAIIDKTVKTEDLAPLKEEETQHADIRVSFDQIKLGVEENNFAGGSNLAELKTLFGEPTKQEQQPAGEVTLDVYEWQIDGISVVAQLYQDSTVATAISNFSFNRQAFIGLKDFEALLDGMTFKQVTDKIGQPDVYSKSVSSGRQDVQAVWVSGMYTDSGARVEVHFEQDKLVKKSQVGLRDKQ